MNLIILLIVFIWGWVEINAFIVIGSEVGVLLTILGVFVTAMIGVIEHFTPSCYGRFFNIPFSVIKDYLSALTYEINCL